MALALTGSASILFPANKAHPGWRPVGSSRFSAGLGAWHHSVWQVRQRNVQGRCMQPFFRTTLSLAVQRVQRACMGSGDGENSCPNWTAFLNLIEVFFWHNLSSCMYFVLCFIFGAARATVGTPTAQSVALASHSCDVKQSTSTSTNFLSLPEPSDVAVVSPKPHSSAEQHWEGSVSKQKFLHSRNHSRFRAHQAWTEQRGLVRGVREDFHSDILFVGMGTGRRKKNNSFVKSAADRVGPSVVRIDTERDCSSEETEMTEPRDNIFRQFFGETGQQVPRRFRRERGQGSGFVFDGITGLIVTNAHVVKGADRVKVTFTDGRLFEGEVAGSDDITDIALIKVSLPSGEALPSAVLGDSGTVELGDWVIAVGNPFGLDNTVSLGIISNLRRTAAEVGILEKRLDFLQTDCAINPGNSGGPLLNEFGEVIGINTAIRADAEGISFAIPINQALKIIETLGAGRPVHHPFFGIQMVTLCEELARQFTAHELNIPPENRQGVLIFKVYPESPAAAAGIISGDIITQVDGMVVTTSVQLEKLIEAAAVGQDFHLVVWRLEEKRTRKVTLQTGDMALYFSKYGTSTGNATGRRGPQQCTEDQSCFIMITNSI